MTYIHGIHSLIFTSGVTPADLLATSMAAEPFSSTYLQGIGGARNWDLSFTSTDDIINRYSSVYMRLSCFSNFVFKIRLIRLDFSLQKQKNSCIWAHNLLNPGQES